MAVALVGGAFLSASLQVIFDRMASPEFLNFFRVQKQDEKLLQKLKDTLLTINVVLDDADNKQFTDPSVKEWLDELQHVVYQADDLVDEIATRGAMQLKAEAEEKSIKTQVLKLMPFCTDTFRKDMESKMENIIERLDYFAKHKDVLGLKYVAGRQFMSDRLSSTSLVDETCVYGRDDELEKIVKLLLSDDESANQISVIPIVGMGGIGKTTLAQLVYNDKRVDGYFDKKAWVCVSEPFDVFVITKAILEAVSSPGCDIKDLNQLQVELIRHLKLKKFLLVLDDVWTEDYNDWDALRRPFTSGAHGSKVLVTTRISDVAYMMQTVPFHHAQKLSNEDCWSIFSKHAFKNGDPSQYPNIEIIGKEIVKKCGGLPLAAKTLGGLLRSKLDVEEWEYIWKSEIWDLSNNKSNIMPSLRLSYQYLHSHLKRCFAYCSTFPKDYKFKKEELVLLWMAQNLLPQQPKSKMKLEEAGDMYFRELLSRSFFQHSFDDESRYVMHDLIHDLAQFVSQEFYYRIDNAKQPGGISEKVRHLSYARHFCFWNDFETYDVFKETNDVKNLRAFQPFDSCDYFYTGWCLTRKVLHEMLPNLRHLRVLSLSCYVITQLPDSIANLIHLRYFDVSYTKIKFLPESITTLYNLQTLLLSNCRSFTKLPQQLRKLNFLRRLDLSGTRITEMPFGMDQLKSLQFLSTFVVGNNSGSRINALGKLDLWKTLTISGMENVINGKDALEANLKGKTHLEDLVLKWNTCRDNLQYEVDVLNNLQPHTNLKILKIKNYGGEELPSWLRGDLLPNMTSLSLKGCGNCLILPQLGQLPSLKFLSITGMKQITIVGPEFFGDDSSIKPFQSLETLKFKGMIKWEEWHMLGAGEFCCLEELYIIDCSKLTGNLPKQATSLRRLEISGCQQLLASLPNGQISIFCNQVGLLLQHCLSSLRRLVISDIPNLAEVPPQLSLLKKLEELVIEECGMMESFSDMGLPYGLKILRIKGCDALKSLPEGMARVNSCLKVLSISKCSSLVSFPAGGLPTTLKRLEIESCRGLEFPNNMGQCYTSIEKLILRDSCDSLKSFPLSLYPNIVALEIDGCMNFESLSTLNRLDNLIRLDCITIWSCPNLVSFPIGGLPAPNLKYFFIRNCMNLKSLPSSFPSLESLDILYCPKVECWEEGCFSSNLQDLSILNCPKLMARRNDWGLQKLPSFRGFLVGGEYEEDVWKRFPEEWLFPSSLSRLLIIDSPKLKALNHEGFQHLTSLRKLDIFECPQLESLSEEVLPSSITELSVKRCPLLRPRYQKEKGKDWPKIAHIPLIKLDDDVL